MLFDESERALYLGYVITVNKVVREGTFFIEGEGRGLIGVVMGRISRLKGRVNNLNGGGGGGSSLFTQMSSIFMHCLIIRHKQVVQLLLDNSADVNIQADDGCTAFDMASIIGEIFSVANLF